MEDMLENTRPLPWMDESFIEKVVRDYFRDPNAKVHSFDITPGSQPGSNSGSIIYRCKLKYSSKNDENSETCWIIKTIPEANQLKKELIEASPIFDTEMRMFSESLPEITDLWKSAGIDSNLFPRLIYKSTTPKTVIIMEDMTESGFTMIDKPPESFEESKLIVQRLAHFHAASYYLANYKNIDYQEYKVIPIDPIIRDIMFDQTLKVFVEELKTWEGYEDYVPKFEELVHTNFDRLRETYQPNKTYNVLNHGDHHTKNLLFKKSDGQIEDVVFIDFQLSVFGTPAIDLIYSFYYDLSTENRQKYRNEYIKYYHDEFVSALKLFGYLKKPPSLMDLHVELIKCGVLETILNVCFNYFMYIDWTIMTPEDFDPANMDAFKRKCFGNPEYQKMVKGELSRLFYQGSI